MALADDRAITDADVAKISGRLGPQLDRVVERGQVAPGHAHVLRGPTRAQREARLEAERIVARFDVAPRDPDVLAAIRIDSIRVTVEDRDVLDIDAPASE